MPAETTAIDWRPGVHDVVAAVWGRGLLKNARRMLTAQRQQVHASGRLAARTGAGKSCELRLRVSDRGLSLTTNISLSTITRTLSRSQRTELHDIQSEGR
jgi:hypothetical protein